MTVSTFESLLGIVMASVTGCVDAGEMVFTAVSGQKFYFYLSSDCGESNHIESVVGELSSLVGSPIVAVEEVPNEYDEDFESYDWQYDVYVNRSSYRISTEKSSVTICWQGSSKEVSSTNVPVISPTSSSGF